MTWVKMNLALRKSLLLRPVRRHNKCCLILVIRSCKMYCILIRGRWDNPSHLRVPKKGNEFPLHPTVYSHLLQPQAPPRICLCEAAPGSETFNLKRKSHCSALERDSAHRYQQWGGWKNILHMHSSHAFCEVFIIYTPPQSMLMNKGNAPCINTEASTETLPSPTNPSLSLSFPYLG